MQFARKPRRHPVINIIPLIDVLVVLLIFYIATTVFKKNQSRIVVQIPSSTEATTTQETPPSIITVKADGELFLDDAPVEPDKLGELLKSKMAADSNFKVAMKPDTKAPFGVIVKVWDAAHEANISNISTFTDPAKPPGDSGP